MPSHARWRLLIAALVLPVALLMAWNQVHLFRFLLQGPRWRITLPGPGSGPLAQHHLEDEAKAAGLVEDDVLREVEARPIRGEWDLAAAIRGHRSGDRSR